MASVLVGVVWEIGNGFIRLSAGSQIRVPSHVWQQGLVVGVPVSVRARLLGAEWVADEIVLDGQPRAMETLIRSVIQAKFAEGRLSRDPLPVVSKKDGTTNARPTTVAPSTPRWK